MRYNELLEEFANRNSICLIPVNKKLSSPEYFIDICHNNRKGRQKLAEIFLENISESINNNFNSKEQ